MKKIIVLFAAMMLALVPAAAASAQSSDGTVTVIHGIPDLDVDVWANGDPLLPGFTFGTVTDALTLPATDYDLEIYAAGTDPEGNDPALAATVTLPAGANVSIIAHLDADAAPTLTVFVNDVSEIAAGEGRVTVRHTAAAPTVDILANDAVLFAGVSNPNEGVIDVPADTYNVKVVAAGGAPADAVFETDLGVPEGTNVIVYAVGDLSVPNFTVAAQTIAGLQAAPTGVPTGTDGVAVDGIPTWLIAAMALGLASVASGRVLATRRNR
jgi:hypothetical protein